LVFRPLRFMLIDRKYEFHLKEMLANDQDTSS
jgi:hypothetical protein